jgi:hypothetical protein
MKIAVLTTVILLVACLSYHCSSRSKIGNNRPDGVRSNAPTPADRSKMRKDLQSRYEEMLTAVKSESTKLGVSSLKDSPEEPGLEVRVLVGFGIAHPRYFIFTNRSGRNEAFLITAKVVSGKAAIDKKGRLLSTRIALSAPSSGWEEFERFLKDQGIESPIKLSLDERETPDPDQEIIVVEVKSGSVYSMVFFQQNTESEDGKKAWAVWEKIKREFNIRMPRPPR